jgi:copper chaperone CopZ
MVGTIITNINGVLEVDTDPANHTATVTFNEKKTTVEAIIQALVDGGFPIEGEPQFLK